MAFSFSIDPVPVGSSNLEHANVLIQWIRRPSGRLRLTLAFASFLETFQCLQWTVSVAQRSLPILQKVSRFLSYAGHRSICFKIISLPMINWASSCLMFIRSWHPTRALCDPTLCGPPKPVWPVSELSDGPIPNFSAGFRVLHKRPIDRQSWHDL